MIVGPLQLILLAGACLCLVGLAFGGIMVARAQQERERLNQRLQTDPELFVSDVKAIFAQTPGAYVFQTLREKR